MDMLKLDKESALHAAEWKESLMDNQAAGTWDIKDVSSPSSTTLEPKARRKPKSSKPPICIIHKLDAILRTWETGVNKGRSFFTCPTENCKVIREWKDPEKREANEATRNQSKPNNTEIRHKGVRRELGGFCDQEPQQGKNLNQLVHGYFAEQILEYKCQEDSCVSNEAHETTMVQQLPEVLVIHVVRFQQHLHTERWAYEKRTDKIGINERLDLSSVLSSSSAYKLQCIIKHMGNDTQYGHYITDVRNEDDTWQRYNDEKKSNISKDDAYLSAKARSDAYILFYILDRDDANL